MLTDITHMSEMSLLTIETMEMAKSDPGIMCWFMYSGVNSYASLVETHQSAVCQAVIKRRKQMP